MNKTEAISKIQCQIDELRKVKATAKFGPTFTKWQRDTRVALLKIFSGNEDTVNEFNEISYALPVFSDATPESAHDQAYQRGLEQAEAFLESCIREIEDYWNETTVTKEQVSDPQIFLENLLLKFHLVARQLCNRYNNRTTIQIVDEYDVQDLLHAMLRIFFDDIRPEEWTPSYAGKSSRMDFLLKDHKIVIEVKMIRRGIGEKEIGTQLIDDIARYRQHAECDTLLCFVYDPEGLVANPAGLEKDLSSDQEGFKVRVLVAPKGH